MDVLADLLYRSRARGAVFAHATWNAPWGWEIADEGPLSFHAILAGHAWLFPPAGSGREPVRLGTGDLALVRSPFSHRLVDDPATPTCPVAMADIWRVPGDPYRYQNPGLGEPTVLLCGAFRFEGDICAPLLEALPSVVCLHTGAGDEDDDLASLRATIRILAAEFSRSAPAQQTVLDRLLDLVLVFALRSWFARPDIDPPPWYRSLDDAEIANALQLMHAQPADHWTVAGLANRVGLSRATFARRFTALVTEPPLAYLTRLRMTLAAQLLREGDVSIAQVARAVGYQNEFAFATAFRRSYEQAPSAYQARHRQLTPDPPASAPHRSVPPATPGGDGEAGVVSASTCRGARQER